MVYFIVLPSRSSFICRIRNSRGSITVGLLESYRNFCPSCKSKWDFPMKLGAKELILKIPVDYNSLDQTTNIQ